MNKINEILLYGQLAELAYLKLEDKLFKENNEYITDIKRAPFSLKKKSDIISFIYGKRMNEITGNYTLISEDDRYEQTNIKEDRKDIAVMLLDKFQIIDFTSDEGFFSSGFQAILLQNISTKKYIIAFRGTSNWKDGLVDGALANIFGSHNFQENEAIEFIEDMIKEHGISKDNLSFTGHSLGGILAQGLGVKLKIKAFAFNPLGTSTLVYDTGSLQINMLIETLESFDIINIDESWVNENILTISYNDVDGLNGDVLSNIVTKLNSSRHLGMKIDIFGKNVDAFVGHSIITLNKLLEKQNEHELTTIADIKEYNKKQKTLFFKLEMDIMAALNVDNKTTIFIQTPQMIKPILEPSTKELITALNHENINYFTINSKNTRVEDKDNFDKKLYYSYEKNRLKLKTEDFKEAVSIVSLISKENQKLKKHDIILELQGVN